MNQNLISIITPVYNAEKNLSKMLDSVLAQTYTQWELILVNDGSTDRTEKIIKEYVQNESRILSFHQSNAGPSVARNKGIEEAKGNYLSFVDADDWISPDYLVKLIEPMLQTEIDLVCAGYYEVNPKFPKGLKLHDFKQDKYNQIISKKEFQSNLFNGVSGVLWAKLFKKEIFKSNAIALIPQMHLSEDLIAVLEYSFYIKSAFVIPESIYYYNRKDETGLSGKLTIANYGDLQRFLNEIDKHRNELYFLNLDSIKRQREYSFMIKILKDHMASKEQYFKVAKFIAKKENSLRPAISQDNKFNNIILNLVFEKKYFQSWLILKAFNILRSVKAF